MKSQKNVVLAGPVGAFVLSVKSFLTDADYRVLFFADLDKSFKSFRTSLNSFCIIAGCRSTDEVSSFIRRLRDVNSFVVVVVVEDRDSDSGRAIEMYKAGADIHLHHPFSQAELLHKMDRMGRWLSMVTAGFPMEFSVGGLLVESKNILTNNGELIRALTDREHEVLAMLAFYRNSIVKRADLLLRFWGKDDPFLGRSLDVLISRIRRYLKMDPAVTLETIHSIGFRLIALSPTKDELKEDNTILKAAV